MKKHDDRKNLGADTVISHGYFQGHRCLLAADKLSVCEIQCSRLRKFVLMLTTAHAGDIRTRNMHRSYAALCAEKYRQYKSCPLIIHPFSKIRLFLDVVFIISMLITNLVVTIHYAEVHAEEMNPHKYIEYGLDGVYLLNIITNFLTGYVEGDTCQHVVLDMKKIFWKYLRTWFFIDLASSISFAPRLFSYNNLRLELVLVSLKLMRFPILLKYTKNLMTYFRAKIMTRTAVEIFLYLFSYLTWTVYFQFIVEYIREDSVNPENPSQCSWMTIGKLWNDTLLERFVYATDRAVGLLRKNSNLHLFNEDGCFENFFIVSWLAAKLIVKHCILKYIIALFGVESSRARYSIMTQQVDTYMNQRRFPPRIKKKILKFYAIRFQSNFFMESRMKACVSGQLREDIIMHTSRLLVGNVTFLKQLPRALLLQIGVKLRVVIYIAGDIIFKINTIGDCLYFIDKGTVAIYSGSGKEVCHLEDGDFFGEIALVMKHRFRTASAVAVTNCELFRLDRRDFESSIACYPTVYNDIKKVATSRFERTCVLDEHHKTEMKLNNEYRHKNDD